jgi:hypothetical protein
MHFHIWKTAVARILYTGFCRIFATELRRAKTVDRSLFGRSSNQNNSSFIKTTWGVPVVANQKAADSQMDYFNSAI